MTTEPTYTINGSTLTIPDPDAFGFDCDDLFEQPDFEVVSNEFTRDRRTYNIHTLVMKHVPTGRYFAREYSTHEDEGFEWGPGEGRDCETTWGEVFPHVVSVTVYKDTPQ